MMYFDNLKILFFLGIVLLILVIIRFIIFKEINKKDIEYANSIIIADEEIQEDYSDIVSEEYGTLAVLADGFGKNENGKIASIVAVKTLKDLFIKEGTKERITYFLRKSFNEANKKVLRRIERDSGGTSVLAAIISDGLLYYALVGETMLCIFRNNELVRITDGHAMSEVAKKQFDLGKIERDKALYALHENKILYYMGRESFKNIEMSDPPIKLQKNDIVVLMSKGIFRNIRWVNLERMLSQKNKKVDVICDEIIKSLEYGVSNSNGSIILMKYLNKND